MPQEITPAAALSESLQESFDNIRENHPGRTVQQGPLQGDVTPYLDVRAALGVAGVGLQYLASTVEGTFTADAVGAADGVDVKLPFTPKLVIAHQRSTNIVYIKFGSHPGAFSLKGTLATPAWAVADNTISVSEDGFQINAAEVTDTHIWHYIAIA